MEATQETSALRRVQQILTVHGCESTIHHPPGDVLYLSVVEGGLQLVNAAGSYDLWRPSFGPLADVEPFVFDMAERDVAATLIHEYRVHEASAT